MNNFLNKIPQWLSSKVSIWIYILLFVYLVIFAAVALLLPAWHHLAPSENAQLVLGNYTNVLSALGASIAAGSGAALHRKMKSQSEKHKEMQDTIASLHKKIDKMMEGKDTN